MEEEIPKKYPTLGDYILLKTLGKGYNSKVKLGSHTSLHLQLRLIYFKVITKGLVLTMQ